MKKECKRFDRDVLHPPPKKKEPMHLRGLECVMCNGLYYVSHGLYYDCCGHE